MTTDLQQTLTEILTECDRAIALGEEATAGEWKAISGDSYCAFPTVMRGNGPHFIILDATEPEGETLDKDDRWYGADADAAQIAHARTFSPTAARMLRVTIQGLIYMEAESDQKHLARSALQRIAADYNKSKL